MSFEDNYNIQFDDKIFKKSLRPFTAAVVKYKLYPSSEQGVERDELAKEIEQGPPKFYEDDMDKWLN